MDLRDWMKNHDMTQGQVAAALGLTQAAVCRYLSGRTPTPSIMVAIHKLTGTEVSPNDFVLSKPPTAENIASQLEDCK